MPHPLLILAPLRGVTQLEFRTCVARHFPGFDLAYSPFLSTLAGDRIRPAHLSDVLPEANAALSLVPQVIGKSPANFRTLLLALRDLGYVRCDLNAGCPWPMVVKRGRGAGLLRNPSNLLAMLDAGCDVFPEGLSLKTRLGVASPDELSALMDRINGYPLAALAVHARTASQMYGGAVDLGRFGEILAAAKMPVYCNGDIATTQDLERLEARFPGAAGFMIGRGAIRDPSIAARAKGASFHDLRAAKVGFMRDYSELNRARLSGPASFLGRMKEFWGYFKDSFPEGEELWRRIRVARTFEEYDAAIADL